MLTGLSARGTARCGGSGRLDLHHSHLPWPHLRSGYLHASGQCPIDRRRPPTGGVGDGIRSGSDVFSSFDGRGSRIVFLITGVLLFGLAGGWAALASPPHQGGTLPGLGGGPPRAVIWQGFAGQDDGQSSRFAGVFLGDDTEPDQTDPKQEAQDQQRPRLLGRGRTQEDASSGPRRLLENRPRLIPPPDGEGGAAQEGRVRERLRGALGGDPNQRLLPLGRPGEGGQGLPERLTDLVDGVERRLENSGNQLSRLTGRGPSAQIISAEAVIGQPYNVGHLVYRLSPEDALRWQARALFVSDAENRVFYPTMLPTLGQRIGGQFQDRPSELPRDIDIWFVFVGRQPLDITIHAGQEHRVVVEPTTVRRLRQRSMTQTWWRQFHTMLEQEAAASDYPPLVQAYLLTMVRQRLGLTTPLLKRSGNADRDPLTETWYLLTGAEDLQVDSLKSLMTDPAAEPAVANLPLPPDVAWRQHHFQQIDPQVEIEPIAKFVPRECFYLRFGKWSNQIWLKHLLDEHGGDLSRMVRLRGYQSLVGDLFRDQLAMESSQLDDLLGGTLIQDVAVIGLDTFFSEGAAAGLILHARNDMLRRNLESKRREYAERHAGRGITLNDLEIGGQTASILQSPDGRVRSILISSGNFHLVTTSYVLAERFLGAAAGQGSLGQSEEFQQARTKMPLSRDDTIFVYLSTGFLENLISPQYQIELRRRMRSVAEIQMLHLATWAAEAHQSPLPGRYEDWEQVPLELRIEALSEAGFLPAGFNRRWDDSRIAVMPNDQVRSPAAAPPELLPRPRQPRDSDDRLPPPDPQPPGDLQDRAPDELRPRGAGSQAADSSLLNSLVGGLFGNRDNGGPAAGQVPADQEGGRRISGSADDRSAVQPAAKLAGPKLPDWQVRPTGDFLYGDSIRGVRGWMIPVADMQIDRVTAEERDWYQSRAQYFAQNWGQTDPIMIGIKRFRMGDSRERVVFDGRVAPFASQRYAWLTDQIGPPLSVRPAPNPDDVIRLELSMAPGALFQNVPAHQLFAAVQRDAQQLQNLDPSEWWTSLKMLQGTPGYIATWPTAGFLDMLPMLGGRPDAEGFTHAIGRGLWRMQHEGFSAVAVDRERLQRLRPYLEMVESETPAQLRLEIGDLAESQLETWVNTLWRQRSWQASLANTRLLHVLMQHFRLEPGRAKQQAQSLLNAELVCSLDGQYLLLGPTGAVVDLPPALGGRPDGLGAAGPWEELPTAEGQAVAFHGQHPLNYHWISDRWPADTRVAAAQWGQEVSPLLSWFRGALVEINQEENRFLVHGYLDINRQGKETAALPSFDMFPGFSRN